MHTTQYHDLFVTYREGFNLTTGNKDTIVADENPLFSRQSISSPLLFDSVKNKIHYPPLKDSNSFGTVDYDAHINTK